MIIFRPKLLGFALLLLNAACSDIETLDNRSGVSSVAQDDFDEDVSLPSEVSGSFLVCTHLEDDIGTSYKTNIGCSVSNSETTGLLSYGTKTTKEAKDYVGGNFELSVITPPSVGDPVEVTPGTEGQFYDFKVTFTATNVLAASNYLNGSVMNLKYTGELNKDSKTMALAGGETTTNFFGQLKAPLADLLEGKGNELVLTEVELEVPTPSKNYSIPGKLLPDFSVEVVGSARRTGVGIQTVAAGETPKDCKDPADLSTPTLETTWIDFDIALYTVSSVGSSHFGFGTAFAQFPMCLYGDLQPAGTTNIWGLKFNDDSVVEGDSYVIDTYGGESAIYSSKVGDDGRLYVVGKKSQFGVDYEADLGGGVTETRTVSENIANAFFGILDPEDETLSMFNAQAGQVWTDEQLFGLELERNRFIGVGVTKGRSDTSGFDAGYIVAYDNDKEKIETFNVSKDPNDINFYHKYFHTNGDTAFNDVSTISDDVYAVAGMVVGENCTYSTGMMIEVDVKNDTTGDFTFYGLSGRDTYFSKILVREDGSYQARGWADFSSTEGANTGLGIDGPHEITIYFNDKLEVISSFLNDGREFVIEKSLNIGCLAP